MTYSAHPVGKNYRLTGTGRQRVILRRLASGSRDLVRRRIVIRMIIVITPGRGGRSRSANRQTRRAGRYCPTTVNRGGGDGDAVIAASIIGAMIGTAVITTPVIRIACVIRSPTVDIAVVPIAGGATSGVVAARPTHCSTTGWSTIRGAATSAMKRAPSEGRRRDRAKEK